MSRLRQSVGCRKVVGTIPRTVIRVTTGSGDRVGAEWNLHHVEKVKIKCPEREVGSDVGNVVFDTRLINSIVSDYSVYKQNKLSVLMLSRSKRIPLRKNLRVPVTSVLSPNEHRLPESQCS